MRHCNPRMAYYLAEKQTPAIVFLLCIILLSASTALTQNDRKLEREDAQKANQSTEKRTALIIGNAEYQTSPLTNPQNDAEDMAAALRGLGFEVILNVNQTRATMIRSIRKFGDRLKSKRGVGLFYYAGHGVQVRGRNYLIPVDASIRSENEVELEGVDVSRVLLEMENASNNLNIVILDACRNNPFSRSWRSTNDGLAQINAPSGTMIAYATAPGRVASDGTGRNGIYTGELLKAIKVPNLTLADVFMKVRAGVQIATQRNQIPWEASSIVGRFYFNRKEGEGAVGPPVSSIAVTGSAEIEQQFWDAIKESRNPEDFQNYIKEYPNGRFLSLARLNLSRLERKTETVSQPGDTVARNTGIRKNSIGMNFAYIPPGEYMMGGTKDKNTRPIRKVTIQNGFWMGKFEVTQAQWTMIMGENPSNFNEDCGDGCPVERVSWNDVQAFIVKLNTMDSEYDYRLPTEAEWEYAARAGNIGDQPAAIDARSWHIKNSLEGKRFGIALRAKKVPRPHAIGMKLPNEFGLHDMQGNVHEWVQDIYNKNGFEGLPSDGSANEAIGDQDKRVFKGGSYLTSPKKLRFSTRNGIGAKKKGVNIGFRLVAIPK